MIQSPPPPRCHVPQGSIFHCQGGNFFRICFSSIFSPSKLGGHITWSKIFPPPTCGGGGITWFVKGNRAGIQRFFLCALLVCLAVGVIFENVHVWVGVCGFVWMVYPGCIFRAQRYSTWKKDSGRDDIEHLDTTPNVIECLFVLTGFFSCRYMEYMEYMICAGVHTIWGIHYLKVVTLIGGCG